MKHGPDLSSAIRMQILPSCDTTHHAAGRGPVEPSKMGYGNGILKLPLDLSKVEDYFIPANGVYLDNVSSQAYLAAPVSENALKFPHAAFLALEVTVSGFRSLLSHYASRHVCLHFYCCPDFELQAPTSLCCGPCKPNCCTMIGKIFPQESWKPAVPFPC